MGHTYTTKELWKKIDLGVWGDLLKEFNPKKKPHYLTFSCPNCKDKKKKAYLYKGGWVIKCNRQNNCGYSLRLWDYIKTRFSLTTNWEVIQKLYEFAGVSFDSTGNTEAYQETLELELKEEVFQQQLSKISEVILDYGKKQLWTEKGKAALDYLTSQRKLTHEEIQKAELGLTPRTFDEAMELFPKAEVGGVDEGIIKWLCKGKTHPIMIPLFSSDQSLKGFVFRAITPEDDPKYLYQDGMKRDEFYNIHQCLEVKDITVVEGFMDVIKAQGRGLEGVVAIGSSTISELQLNNLLEVNPELQSVTLCLDRDKSGLEGTHRSIKLLKAKGVMTYVASIEAPDKDPDELMDRLGVKDFEGVLSQAQDALVWQVHQELHKIEDLTIDRHFTDKQIDILLRALMEDYPNKGDQQKIVETISDKGGISLDKVQERHKEIVHQQENLKLHQQEKDIRLNLKKALTQSDDKAIFKLSKELQNLKGEGGDNSYRLQPYTINHFKEDILNSPLGYQTNFTKLDQVISFYPGALSIIAARPGHGKTTFMLNLLSNMSHKYQDHTFIFFSYEERACQVANKLIHLEACKNIFKTYTTPTSYPHNIPPYGSSSTFNILKGCYVNPLEYQQSIMVDAILNAREEFTKITQDERLILVEKMLTVQEFRGVLKQAYHDNPNKIIVFIDYVQKIPTKEKANTRQLELQKTSSVLLQTAKETNIPIILACQFGRPSGQSLSSAIRLDNLRECGDIEQDANVCISVHNKYLEKCDNTNTENDQNCKMAEQQEWEIKILKNRNGQAGRTIPYQFLPKALIVQEIDKKDSNSSRFSRE